MLRENLSCGVNGLEDGGLGTTLSLRLFAVCGVVCGGFPDRSGDCLWLALRGAEPFAGAAFCGVAGGGGAPLRGLSGPLCWRTRVGGGGFLAAGWEGGGLGIRPPYLGC